MLRLKMSILEVKMIIIMWGNPLLVASGILQIFAVTLLWLWVTTNFRTLQYGSQRPVMPLTAVSNTKFVVVVDSRSLWSSLKSLCWMMADIYTYWVSDCMPLPSHPVQSICHGSNSRCLSDSGNILRNSTLILLSLSATSMQSAWRCDDNDLYHSHSNVVCALSHRSILQHSMDVSKEIVVVITTWQWTRMYM